MKEDFLHKKLDERKTQNAYRELKLAEGMIDFCSNDYLGLSRLLQADSPSNGSVKHGSTGSRLLAGNYPLINETEELIAAFHATPAALIFNSGYDANIGLLSCVPQRGDTIMYDYLSHASIRDGIRLSFAESFSFPHNNLDELEEKLKKTTGNKFVVTESVFSMDGDLAPLAEMVTICERYGAHLIVDEAHATGVIGKKGEGLVQELNLQSHCFARIHTFGKALGCHGAAVLGSAALRNYLINFSRAFIYTTSLPESSVRAIRMSYELFPHMHAERDQLRKLVGEFQQSSMKFKKQQSNTPIQAVIVPGNEEVKDVAGQLQAKQFDIRPILYPTVPANSERLRIVLHAFNTMEQIRSLTGSLQ